MTEQSQNRLWVRIVFHQCAVRRNPSQSSWFQQHQYCMSHLERPTVKCLCDSWPVTPPRRLMNRHVCRKLQNTADTASGRRRGNAPHSLQVNSALQSSLTAQGLSKQIKRAPLPTPPLSVYFGLRYTLHVSEWAPHVKLLQLEEFGCSCCDEEWQLWVCVCVSSP